MANKNVNPAEEGNTIDQLNDNLTAASQKVAENKKIIYIILAAVVAAGLLVAAYFYFFHIPGIEKGNDALAAAQMTKADPQKGTPATLIQNDTILAKNFAKVADNYGGYPGNLAAIQAAEHFYEIGDFKNALKYIDKFSTSEDVLSASALVFKGDCQVNLKKYDDAIKSYKSAISESDENPEIAPRAMMKIATVLEAQNKKADALAQYEQVAKDYPAYIYNGMPITSYIERTKAAMGK